MIFLAFFSGVLGLICLWRPIRFNSISKVCLLSSHGSVDNSAMVMTSVVPLTPPTINIEISSLACRSSYCMIIDIQASSSYFWWLRTGRQWLIILCSVDRCPSRRIRADIWQWHSPIFEIVPFTALIGARETIMYTLHGRCMLSLQRLLYTARYMLC